MDVLILHMLTKKTRENIPNDRSVTKPVQLYFTESSKETWAGINCVEFLHSYHLYKLETLTSFKYLGSVITDRGSKPEPLSRIAQTTAALTRLKPVWNDRGISLSSKIQLMHASLSHLSSCMPVNHGPSQQSSKEECKPWK